MELAPPSGGVSIMHKERILLRIDHIQDQLNSVSEKMYNPSITTSEYKELNKKKKKLIKDIEKLKKKAHNVEQ
jgi:hypothetical protein